MGEGGLLQWGSSHAKVVETAWLKTDPSNKHFVLGSQTGQKVPLTENAFNYLLAILNELAKGHFPPAILDRKTKVHYIVGAPNNMCVYPPMELLV